MSVLKVDQTFPPPLDFFTCRKILGEVNLTPLHGNTKAAAALRNPRVTTNVFPNLMATRLLAWNCKAIKFKDQVLCVCVSGECARCYDRKSFFRSNFPRRTKFQPIK